MFSIMLDGILHLGVNLSIEQDENKLNIYNNSILLSTVLFDTEEDAIEAVNNLLSAAASGSTFINFDTKNFINERKISILGKDVDTGLASEVFVKNGALQVDLSEIEEVNLNLPEGTSLQVEFPEAQDVNLIKLVPAGQTVQIAAGASLSSSFDISGITAFGIGVPYGTEGVYFSLLVSVDDSAFFTLPERLPFVADEIGENYACNGAGIGLMELLAPWKYCKIQTLDGEGAAQVQTSNRDLTVVMR